MTKKLRILFMVQGEGRGHLTQAIALDEILRKTGYEVIAVFTGSSPQREIPHFFRSHFDKKVFTFRSPNMIRDKNDKGVKMLSSLLINLMICPVFIKSIFKINKKIKELQPDLIINFHELLTGFWKMWFNSSIPVVSIAHQYVYYHSSFRFPKISLFDRLSLNIVNTITTYGSAKRVALNFSVLPNEENRKLIITPPLVRKTIQNAKVTNVNHLLFYILNQGYTEDIIKFHKQNPDQQIHCFCNRKESPEEEFITPQLVFHQLHAEKYIQLLSSCNALITTAGFESVCEAGYLGKAVIAIPVKNHPEQVINAIEAEKSGIAISFPDFSLNNIFEKIQDQKDNHDFKNWVNQAEEIIIREIKYFEDI